MSGGNSILFFDGECGLCNRFVRFALNRDRRHLFHYAPIGGATWSRVVNRDFGTTPTTVYLLSNGQLFERSSAIVRILFGLGPFWRLVGGLLWIIPLPVRNLGYRGVARVRYAIAGRTKSCSLPNTDDKDRLLP